MQPHTTVSTCFDAPLIERALRTAAAAHRNQHRKQTDVPYITHPAAVALLLARAGFTEEVLLAAALLHDVVEDTELTEDDLAREFPPAVVDIVRAASEHKLDEKGAKRPWADRKTEHLRQVAVSSLPARTVVLADKLHNLQSMLYDLDADADLWNRFGAPREKILEYHAAMIDAAAGADSILSELASAARDVLHRLREHRP